MQTDKVRFRYAGIDPCEICNGVGFGVTLFTQGCTRHCEGCHNPSTWDPDGGIPWSVDAIETLRARLERPYITRLTISGGEPFESLWLTLGWATWFKDMFPEKQLWIYTGNPFEDVVNNNAASPILALTDVVVDGPFIIARRDITLAFRGSTNQRIVDVQRSIATGEIVLWRNGAY